METAQWRLILSRPATGPLNMAIDEAILEAIGKGLVLPTLRLYSWEPACLSLGYAQPAADVDQALLNFYKWDLVRRPTGGRAILHTDELTYSVIAPLNEPRVKGRVLDSYHRLSQALVVGLEILGLPVRAASESSKEAVTQPNGPVCFEVPSNYEITFNGKKLIGSAQARRKEGVLQHGSLPLTGDLTRITCTLYYENDATRREAAERLLQRATTVEAALGRQVSWDEAARAFENGFRQALNLDFIPDEITPAENDRALQLAAGKYGNPEWVNRI